MTSLTTDYDPLEGAKPLLKVDPDKFYHYDRRPQNQVLSKPKVKRTERWISIPHKPAAKPNKRVTKRAKPTVKWQSNKAAREFDKDERIAARLCEKAKKDPKNNPRTHRYFRKNVNYNALQTKLVTLNKQSPSKVQSKVQETTTASHGPDYAYVRGKGDTPPRQYHTRDKRDCEYCRDYYALIEKQGIQVSPNSSKLAFSRHTKHCQVAQSNTPEGFWELEFVDSMQREQKNADNKKQGKLAPRKLAF